MLRAQAEAVTVEPDRKGAPEVSLTGRISRCRADTPSHCGWLRPETGLLALFGVASRNALFLRARQVAVDLGNVGLDNGAALARPALAPCQDPRPPTRAEIRVGEPGQRPL
jgi:hypothetical protein